MRKRRTTAGELPLVESLTQFTGIRPMVFDGESQAQMGRARRRCIVGPPILKEFGT